MTCAECNAILVPRDRDPRRMSLSVYDRNRPLVFCARVCLTAWLDHHPLAGSLSSSDDLYGRKTPGGA